MVGFTEGPNLPRLGAGGEPSLSEMSGREIPFLTVASGAPRRPFNPFYIPTAGISEEDDFKCPAQSDQRGDTLSLINSIVAKFSIF